MRFAMRSRRGPHAPIGHNAPKVMLLCAPLCSYNGAGFFSITEHRIKAICNKVYALQGLREKIDSRLTKVQEIRFEPRLLSEEDDRLKHPSQISESLCFLCKQFTFVSERIRG